MKDNKMSFKHILSIGRQILIARPVLLAVSMLLLVFSSALYGVVFIASCTDVYDIELTWLYERNWKVVRLAADNPRLTHGGWYNFGFSPKQQEIIKEYNYGKDMSCFLMGAISADDRKWPFDYIVDVDGYKASDDCCYGYMSWDPILIEVNPVSACEDFDLRPDDRLLDSMINRMPQTFDEIAISDLFASFFMRYGYKEADGTAIEVHTPDDMIGKRIGPFEVCGVFSTDMDRAYFEQFSNIGMKELQEKDSYNARIIKGCGIAIIYSMYIHEGYYDSLVYEMLQTPRPGLGNDLPSQGTNLIKLSGDKNKDLKLCADLNRRDEYGTCSVQILSPLNHLKDHLHFFLRVEVQVLYQLGTGAVAVVTFIIIKILFNLSFRKIKDLCPPNVRKRDLAFIYLTVGGMLVVICFTVSLFAAVAICAIINVKFSVNLFCVTFASVALIFAVCAGIVILDVVFTVISKVRVATQNAKALDEHSSDPPTLSDLPGEQDKVSK